MANLSNAYQTEISYLKENLEQQISNLKETTQKTTDDLQKQIDTLTENYDRQITELKADYDARLAALEQKSDDADAELKAAMEAYVEALREQMTVADEETRARLQAQLDNLSGAFNERLEVILQEYEQRIEKVKGQIEDLESDTKTDLITQKALLEQECRNEVANLNRSYADKIAELQKKLSGDPENADLYYARIAALEKELTSKISETNLSYQKLILKSTVSFADFRTRARPSFWRN